MSESRSPWTRGCWRLVTCKAETTVLLLPFPPDNHIQLLARMSTWGRWTSAAVREVTWRLLPCMPTGLQKIKWTQVRGCLKTGRKPRVKQWLLWEVELELTGCSAVHVHTYVCVYLCTHLVCAYQSKHYAYFHMHTYINAEPYIWAICIDGCCGRAAGWWGTPRFQKIWRPVRPVSHLGSGCTVIFVVSAVTSVLISLFKEYGTTNPLFQRTSVWQWQLF